MQEMHFETEQGINYLVVPCKEKIMRNRYRCVVLEQLSIPCFLNYSIRELNGEQRIYYRMSYRVTLKQILGDIQLGYDFVKAMIGSIVDAITQVEEYLLDINDIIWKTDAIFVEVNTGRLQFVYFPGKKTMPDSVKQLLGEIIPFVEKKNQQTYLYLMEFYNLITNTNCSVDELANFCKKEVKDSVIDYHVGEEMHETIDTNTDWSNVQETSGVTDCKSEKTITSKNYIHAIVLAVVSFLVLTEIILLLCEVLSYQYIWILPASLLVLFLVFVTYRADKDKDNPDTIMEEYLREQQKQPMKPISVQNKWDEVVIEETTVLSEKEEIVVEERPKEKYLASRNLSVANDICFHKPGIMLGTMVSACDAVIAQKGISRMHAKICIREDGIYVLDLNSTNGTYLNGERLHCGDEYPLAVGDILSLARVVEFEMKEREGSDM